MTLVLTISRDHLGLEPLEIRSDSTDDTLWLSADRGPAPTTTPRRRTDAHATGHAVRTALMGDTPTGRGPLVLEGPTLDITVYAQGEAATSLWATRAALTTALGQASYRVTSTDAHGTSSWTARPGQARWTPITGRTVRGKRARATVAIPVR